MKNRFSIFVIAVIATVGLSGCVTTTPVYRNPLPPSTASAGEINKAKQGVRDQMKDPSSVQFRNLGAYYRGEPGFTTLCGELNAKNSFGGYTGFRHFTALAGIVVMNEMEGKPEPWENQFNRHWNESCKP